MVFNIMFPFRNYDEARKAYINALKYDNNNQNVLRDLALLQVHCRDYPGFTESRRQIAVEKPILNNWVQYCVGAYLTKDYDLALQVFESIELIIADKPHEHLKMNEVNELYLFKAKILEDKGNYK